MATFVIYGTEYEGAQIGYRELCEMERRFHIQISDLGELQLNAIAAYIGISCKDIIDPYRAAEDYVIENGNFDAIISAMSEAMEESRFFKALQSRMEQAEEAKTGRGSDSNTRKEDQKKERRSITDYPTIREWVESECLPQALALGVSYELFWSPGFCPRDMNAFVEAHRLKAKEEDQMMYRMSCYINEATFNAVYNSIGLGFGKNFKPVDYRKQSYSDEIEKKETGKELTEEEIREQTIRYFELLELRAFNFRQAKKEKEEAEANESNGIDISSHQAGINISKLTSTDFVIVKATQGTTYVNPYFTKHYDAAKKAGKLLGTYHYFGGNDPVKEADFYIKTVGSRVGEGILVLDWEGYQNSSFAKGPSVAWKFLQRVHEKTGIWPMIYMSKSVTRSYNWSTVAKYCGLWVAQYANSNRTDYQSKPWTDSKGTGAWPTVAIYQYSSKGKITGYSSTIDINIAYLSDGSWKLYANPRKQEQPTSTKVVDYFPGPDDNAKYICMAYQEVLAGRGYYKGAIDGYWGPKSIAAAKELQKKFGMDENGIMNEETVLALFGWRV